MRDDDTSLLRGALQHVGIRPTSQRLVPDRAHVVPTRAETADDVRSDVLVCQEWEVERLHAVIGRSHVRSPRSAFAAIAEYQRKRHEKGAANRTINMDVGVLSRVLKSCGRWRALTDHVRNLPERQRPIGRALAPEERRRLFAKKLIYVRRSKNETSHRVIPLNASAITAIIRMIERADLLGHTEPDHFLWPACQWGRYDPTQPM